MGWLQEVKDALLGRETAESAARVEEQLRRADRLRLDAELANREIARRRKEALNLLRSSGVRPLLEDVRREVWKEGEIEEFITSGGRWNDEENWHYCNVAIGLVYRYIRFVPRVDGSSLHSVEDRVEVREVLSMGIRLDDAALKYHLCGCGDEEVLLANDPRMLDKMRDFFIKDSVERVAIHHLPQDLKSEYLYR